MPRKTALALLAVVLLAACGGRSEPVARGQTAAAAPAPARHAPCDDGGSGGVMIEGVCL